MMEAHSLVRTQKKREGGREGGKEGGLFMHACKGN